MKKYKATQDLPVLNVKKGGVCEADPGVEPVISYVRRGWLVCIEVEDDPKVSNQADDEVPAPKRRGRPRKADK
jgi:hypothetical protein